MQVPFEPVPVTKEDRERKMNDRQCQVSTDEVRLRIPSTKPPLEYFLVDDQDRYWFARPMSEPDSVSWRVADPNREKENAMSMTKDVYLMTVRDGHAYGLPIKESGPRPG